MGNHRMRILLPSKWSLLKTPPPTSETTKQMPCSGESTRPTVEGETVFSDALSVAIQNNYQIIQKQRWWKHFCKHLSNKHCFVKCVLSVRVTEESSIQCVLRHSLYKSYQKPKDLDAGTSVACIPSIWFWMGLQTNNGVEAMNPKV